MVFIGVVVVVVMVIVVIMIVVIAFVVTVGIVVVVAIFGDVMVRVVLFFDRCLHITLRISGGISVWKCRGTHVSNYMQRGKVVFIMLRHNY